MPHLQAGEGHFSAPVLEMPKERTGTLGDVEEQMVWVDSASEPPIILKTENEYDGRPRLPNGYHEIQRPQGNYMQLILFTDILYV